MTDPDKDGADSVTVRMASDGVSDPELLEQVYRLETEQKRAQLEAQQERSLAQIAVEKLVESLDPEDLVPLVRLVIEAGIKARTRSETDPKTKTKPSTGNVSDTDQSSAPATSPVREKLEDLDQ